MSDALDRCIAFIRELQSQAAEQSIRTENGVVHLAPTLPRVWYRNFLSVDLGASAATAELVAEAEAVQGRARLRHRKIQVDDDLGGRVAPAFRELGWSVEELVVMLHDGSRGPRDSIARPASSATGSPTAMPPETVEVDAEELAPVWAKGIAEHDRDEETVRQLVASQLERREAVHVRYFAARADDQPVAYCELFSGRGIGQIESVMTLEEFRGRGLGKAVVSRAIAESANAGHDLTFLLADAHDWPKELYRKLGFSEIGQTWAFLREPQPSSPRA